MSSSWYKIKLPRVKKMKIWIDADGFPAICRELLYRIANRCKIETLVVADRWFELPNSAQLRRVVVQKGANAADRFIKKNVKEGDIVCSNDYALLRQIHQLSAIGITPYGKIINKDHDIELPDWYKNIPLMSDVYHYYRHTQTQHSPFSHKDKAKFANTVDRILQKNLPNISAY